MKKFEEIDTSASIKKALREMGFEEATEVQSRVIPLIYKGSNVIAKSYTGSGKTAAFGIPISDRILGKQSRAVLILGPTRELVVQVKDELRQINKHTGLRIFAVYGGHGIEGEISALRGRVDILCATPGRLLDHLERRTLNPKIFDAVVLDEADRMLDMGFIDDIRKVLNAVKPKNTHLFSATLDGKVAEVIRSYIPTYDEVIIKDEIIGKNIIEKKLIVTRDQKFRELMNYVKQAGRDRVLVFVSTKRYADVLNERLSKRGLKAACIHGDMSQSKRESSLEQFKRGVRNVLIATDVAARGLQIDNVEYVINYDEAVDADTHKHRIGRTGRMGNTGYAITFLDDNSSPRPARGNGGRDSRGGGRNGRSSRDSEERKPREIHPISFHIERGY